MSKKTNNKNGSLGRALIKDRFSSKKANRGHDNLLHTSELNDGYDWGRLNLQSVTEQNSFEEFLATAELAGTEFQAEKLNITFVRPNAFGVPTCEERKKFEKTKEEKKKLLKIPRRPKWNTSMTGEELQEAERQSFLEWRRTLAALQDDDGIMLTPYEKNLDFWRQLWRVIERSDIVVQIVDARNPLLFRCEDLEDYVKEVNCTKGNMLLLNKADFLTDEQRRIWAEYFDRRQIRIAFFSAVKAAMSFQQEDITEQQVDTDESQNEGEYDTTEEEEEEDSEKEIGMGNTAKPAIMNEKKDESKSELDKSRGLQDGRDYDIRGWVNSPEVLGRDGLIELFSRLVQQHPMSNTKKEYSEEVTCASLSPKEDNNDKNIATIGLVGYPNVGKSSTINALLMNKKVSVSATPGKTKHFQTILVKEDLMLCDCPGLVMPMMVASRADMLLWGILPIDQMRDYEAPVHLLSLLLCGTSSGGRHQLETHYSVMFPPPLEGENPNRPPTARELLDVYAYSRGMMTQNGQPDGARAARHLLKDFVEGKLLHCCSPPGVDQMSFHNFITPKSGARVPQPTTQAIRAVRQMNRQSGDELDRAFFNKMSLGAHVKGVSKIIPGQNSGVHNVEKSKKPWKDHSEKRNKREKLRRLYRHLDQ